MVFASDQRHPAEFVACSTAMRHILALMAHVAPSSQTVCLQGETGTGKASLAKLVHARSGRWGRLVRVFCGAHNAEQLEQRLFGRWRDSDGASAGPNRSLIEQAEGGTLLLDDIEEFPLELRPQLMDMLENARQYRLGETPAIRLVVTMSTNRRKPVGRDQNTASWFDCDDTCRIRIPPLRMRLDDLRPLTEHFLDQFRDLSKSRSRCRNRLTQRSWKQLFEYSWPGNVQELSNVVKQSILFSRALCDGRLDVSWGTAGPPRIGGR